MALHLYRRHRADCVAGHREDSKSSALEERRKGWRRCECAIHVSGTLAGRFSRRSTGRADWDGARECVDALETSGAWSQISTAPVSSAPLPATASRITVADALTRFLANRHAMVAESTYWKYRTFATQLQAFADSRGYVLLDQFRAEDIDAFYTESTLGPRSKAKMLDRLRSFFKFCVNRDWLPKSPVSSDLKPPAGSNRAVNKAPFTDAQLADIIAACDQLETRNWGNRFGSGIWTGEDLKEFIWVMVHTGLRISDTVLFDMGRVRGNEVFLRAKKNGGDVFAYIPDWLRDRLLARAEERGRQPFQISTTARLSSAIDIWRQRLMQVFELADVGEERATPHRFRHTFARILLEKGVPVADVADLLGDNEKTVREHYARWVPERQARLTRILKNAFSPPRKPARAARRAIRS